MNKLEYKLEKYKSFQPIKAENQRRLDLKFRLEFNYNSNHLEGNTLTYGETELLLIKGISTGDHHKRELDEMEAHDLAFSLIKEWADDKTRDINEIDIKSLNKIILVKPFWKEAITEDGQPTRRLLRVGQYKEYPNSVRQQNGEIFHYASPEDTPIRMHELLIWYSNQSRETLEDIINLAALFHYKFVLIHPFDDGNGRIARLLVNFILLSNNLPPIVIKSADKKAYLMALAKADKGDIKAFENYISQQLEWSMDICIKAAQGEVIEEKDDWEKKLTLLSKKGSSSPKLRDPEITLQRLKDSIVPAAIRIKDTSNDKFLQLFERINFDFSTGSIDILPFINSAPIENLSFDHFKFSSENKITFTTTFITYKKNGTHTFNVQISLIFIFSEYEYKCIDQHGNLYFKKQIDVALSENDINNLISKFGSHAITQIEKEIDS